MFEWSNGGTGVKCNDMVHAEKAGVSRNGKVPYRETWPELDATTTRVPPLYQHYTRPYRSACLPCTAVSQSCRASLFSPSSLVFHALYTTNTSCTVLLSLVVVSSTLC
jgi:hypothetical protein